MVVIRRNRRSVGISLIELLVVIAIILVLAGIVWAVLQPARDRALQATCASKMRQIWIALENYRQDYGGFDPPAAKNPVEAGLPATRLSTNLFRARYVKRFPDGFHCPTHNIPSYVLRMRQVRPDFRCVFPCLDQRGWLAYCDMNNCAEYMFGYDRARDSISLPEERAHVEREDALFRALGMNFEILYDPHHNPPDPEDHDPRKRFVYLFLHLDGHLSRKVIPNFLIYRMNTYDELIGD